MKLPRTKEACVCKVLVLSFLLLLLQYFTLITSHKLSVSKAIQGTALNLHVERLYRRNVLDSGCRMNKADCTLSECMLANFACLVSTVLASFAVASLFLGVNQEQIKWVGDYL